MEKQVRFFLPLTITALLTVTTHSLFNAGLARFPSPEVFIAAFAVAKSVMHILESPVQMVRQTVAALVDNDHNYRRVRHFLSIIVGAIVLLFAFMVFSGISRWLMRNIMGLDGEVLDAAVSILRVLMVFPLAATARNFLQGILIRFRVTPLLTVATVVRIIYVIIFVANVDKLMWIPHGALAGFMFLSAISVEALLLWLGGRLVVGNVSKRFVAKERKSTADASKANLTYRVIYGFFGPLVLTSLIKTLAQPVINTGLARTASPEMALSAYAVAWGLAMIFFSPVGMFHQVPLNFIDDKDHSKTIAVRNFAIGLGVLLSAILALVSFTEIGYLILTRLIGASEAISVMAADVLKLASILPLLMVSREFYWGLLMKRRKTEYLGKGKVVNLIALTSAILVMTFINPSNPAIVGIVGMIACESAEVLYLVKSTRKYEREHNKAPASGLLFGGSKRRCNEQGTN